MSGLWTFLTPQRDSVRLMSEQSREALILDSFATLADTLVDDYDVLELLQTLVETCERLLDVRAAGILLADPNNQLEVVASTSEASRLVEIMQIGAEAGPCVESFTKGTVVSVPDVTVDERWEEFSAHALSQGFRAVYAVPLRLRATVIGALNLFRSEPGEFTDYDRTAAQALADVATIGILHQRAYEQTEVVRDQLASALQSRVRIEQAKGVISHTRGTTTDEAFTIIRDYARSHRQRLSEVAQQIVERNIRL